MTITTRTAFAKALIEIRQRGCAIDNEEFERGAYCIAVPILDRDRHSSPCLERFGAGSPDACAGTLDYPGAAPRLSDDEPRSPVGRRGESLN